MDHVIQSINDECSLAIETSRFIDRASRLTGFYASNIGCYWVKFLLNEVMRLVGYEVGSSTTYLHLYFCWLLPFGMETNILRILMFKKQYLVINLSRNHLELDQFHLHWSDNNGEGSEHTIDGKAFPGEV